MTPAPYQRYWDRSDEQYGSIIGTDNPDLTAFRDRGGKIIIWHGSAPMSSSSPNARSTTTNACRRR